MTPKRELYRTAKFVCSSNIMTYAMTSPYSLTKLTLHEACRIGIKLKLTSCSYLKNPDLFVKLDI